MGSDADEWIHVVNAYQVVSRHLLDGQAAVSALRTRLESGLIEARASKGVQKRGTDVQTQENVAVPISIWSDGAMLTAQKFWQIGDYHLIGDPFSHKRVDFYLSGIHLRKAQVMDLIPPQSSAAPNTGPPQQAKQQALTRRGGPPFNLQHFYAAAKVAQNIAALSEDDRRELKGSLVGSMLTEHYKDSTHAPPDGENRDRAGAAILRAFDADPPA